MATQNPNRTPMYPQIHDPNDSNPFHSSSSKPSLYPQIDIKDLADNLFPQTHQPSAPPECVEELLITVPGAILHLIDKTYSVELASGDLSLLRLRQGPNVVAVLARVADEIQWPLSRDEAAVKLDESHYFFSFKPPNDAVSDDSDSDDDKKKNPRSDSDDLLNYGLTIASKGQEGLLSQLDELLEHYCSFSVQEVKESMAAAATAKETSPGELKEEEKKREMERHCAAYWTTLAPNVEEYSGTVAKMIAKGSGQLIKGILWCGDVTVDRLKWGNEVMMKRLKPDGTKAEVSPETMRRIQRVKRVTKMTESVAIGVLSGVVKVSGFFSSAVANSKVGKKFFGLLPGEIVLASLDGFSKVCDAAEIAGRNVMSTSSTVTTGLVSHKYGEEAAKATSEGLEAAGHAAGTAWAVLKLRQALNPKSALKPTTLAKSAAKKAEHLKKSAAKTAEKASKSSSSSK